MAVECEERGKLMRDVWAGLTSALGTGMARLRDLAAEQQLR